MNRFFYKCGRCLFKATMENEQRHAPPAPQCPICERERLTLLGATRGILVSRSPCNDLCNYATGRDCECSCGGRNHGKGIVVYASALVVEFPSGFPTAHRDGLRAKYEELCGVMRQIKAALPEDILHARDLMKRGLYVPCTADWIAAKRWARRFAAVWDYQDYRHRMKAARAMLAELRPACPEPDFQLAAA